MAVALFAGRRVGDCELVCALATERPSPVRTINANGLSSRVEELLLIRFLFIAFVLVCAPQRYGERDRHNGRSPPLALAFL